MTDQNTEADVVAALKGVRFLQDASDDLMDRLAENARLVEFPQDAVVFREGDPARAIYLIVAGKVALELCAPAVGCKRILTVGPSELLGWSPALGHERLTATARVLEAAQLVEIDASRLGAVCGQDPRVGYEFMTRVAEALAKRLTATRLQMLDVYGSQMPETPGERSSNRQEQHAAP